MEKPTAQTPCARCPKPIMRGSRYVRLPDNRLVHWTCAEPDEQDSGLYTGVVPRSNEEHEGEKRARDLERGVEI